MNNTELNVVSDNQVSPTGTLKRRVLYDRKRNYIASKPNVMHELLRRFPDKEWDWNVLAENPNIDLAILLNADKLGHKPNFDELGCWRHETECLVSKRHAELPDKFQCDQVFYQQISANENITTLDFVEKTIDEHPWHYDMLAQNPNLTADFILRHWDKPWSLHWASLSPNIMPEEFVEIVKKTSHPTNFGYLGGNPNLTEQFVEEHPEIYFDYHLYGNDNISLNFLKAKGMSKQSNGTYDRSDIKLDKIGGSVNNLDGHDIRLIINPSMMPRDLKQHFSDYLMFKNWWVQNASLDLEFIIEHIEHVDFRGLSNNKFLWDDRVYKREIARDVAARRARLCEIISGEGLIPRDLSRIIMRYVDWE